MSDKTGIEWTDATWNPLRGTKGSWTCTKVSPACVYCYAERMNVRFGGPKYVAGADQIRLHADILDQPTRWKKRRMIFVCSMTDLFHEDVTDAMLYQIFAVMLLADHHTYQILTKRAERMRAFLSQGHFLYGPINEAAREITGKDIAVLPTQAHGMVPGSLPAKHIWLGVSVENQEYTARIPILLKTPAAVRFISAEPLMSELNLRQSFAHSVHCHLGHSMGEPVCRCPRLHWVIVGGESGPHARPIHPDWVRDIRDQCATAKVPFFFKQWGEWTPEPQKLIKISRNRYKPESVCFRPDGSKYNPLEPDTLFEDGMISMYRIGKRKAGRLLDGVLYDEIPEGDTADRGFIIENL